MGRTVLRRGLLGLLVVLAAGMALHLFGGGILGRTALALRHLDADTLGLAVACGASSMLISGLMWWRLIGHLGYPVSPRVGIATYLSAGLAGYLVNAAGPVIGCAVSLRRHGVCPGRAVLLTLMANALGFCGILIWTPVGLLLLSRSGMDRTLPILGRHGPAVAAAIVVGLALVMLATLHALASASGSGKRLARRLLGNAPRPEGKPVRVRTRHLLSLVPWSAGSWLAGTLALYVILQGLHAGDINLGDVIGSAALASALGSLAFFVPEGMGVGDGALVALLAHSTGLPVAQCAAAAIAVRALDPLTKLGMLLGLTAVAHPRVARPLTHMRAALWARWPHAPAHPTLRLPWYLWRAAFEARN